MIYLNSRNKSYKFITIFTIFTIILLNFSFTLAYSGVTNFAPKYGTTTTKTNFRSVPSTSSQVIRVIDKDTNVKMVGTSGDFYIVQLSTNEVGYLSKDYVKSSNSAPSGAATYTNMSAKIGTVNGDSVNFRRGPGSSFSIISKLSKGTNLKVIGSIDNFYLAVLNNNTVGMISKDYVSLSGIGNEPPSSNNNNSNAPTTSDAQLVLKLINEYRAKNGLPALIMGVKLEKMAALKANDMVSNNYFSHTSPTYGSPFDMMKNNGLSYKSAGENIAGNPSLEGAVNSWINSETHRENLLSKSYNYIGIGVTPSSVYGYVVVAMFAEV